MAQKHKIRLLKAGSVLVANNEVKFNNKITIYAFIITIFSVIGIVNDSLDLYQKIIDFLTK